MSMLIHYIYVDIISRDPTNINFLFYVLRSFSSLHVWQLLHQGTAYHGFDFDYLIHLPFSPGFPFVHLPFPSPDSSLSPTSMVLTLKACWPHYVAMVSLASAWSCYTPSPNCYDSKSSPESLDYVMSWSKWHSFSSLKSSLFQSSVDGGWTFVH